ncbi:hypothetical protein CFR76_12765 [Komagataeibacter swingsii]|uniref:Uncharacterized protein n=1 Tax=Komagataeibacter swingsii TaxID=215220 RepID=A0A2V4S1A1_9PROT|nr:hypothetical protein CFR76_12765 [Komagataeibacter swingsii]
MQVAATRCNDIHQAMRRMALTLGCRGRGSMAGAVIAGRAGCCFNPVPVVRSCRAPESYGSGGLSRPYQARADATA